MIVLKRTYDELLSDYRHYFERARNLRDELDRRRWDLTDALEESARLRQSLGDGTVIGIRLCFAQPDGFYTYEIVALGRDAYLDPESRTLTVYNDAGEAIAEFANTSYWRLLYNDTSPLPSKE